MGVIVGGWILWGVVDGGRGGVSDLVENVVGGWGWGVMV